MKDIKHHCHKLSVFVCLGMTSSYDMCHHIICRSRVAQLET